MKEYIALVPLSDGTKVGGTTKLPDEAAKILIDAKAIKPKDGGK